MTYIERQALIKEFDKISDHDVDVDEAIELIANSPVADVAPVKRAKWHQKRIYVAKAKGHSYCVWACSNCHKQAKERSNYCPDCGTDMRED